MALGDAYRSQQGRIASAVSYILLLWGRSHRGVAGECITAYKSKGRSWSQSGGFVQDVLDIVKCALAELEFVIIPPSLKAA